MCCPYLEMKHKWSSCVSFFLVNWVLPKLNDVNIPSCLLSTYVPLSPKHYCNAVISLRHLLWVIFPKLCVFLSKIWVKGSFSSFLYLLAPYLLDSFIEIFEGLTRPSRYEFTRFSVCQYWLISCYYNHLYIMMYLVVHSISVSLYPVLLPAWRNDVQTCPFCDHMQTAAGRLYSGYFLAGNYKHNK